jgi:hypothetical protein
VSLKCSFLIQDIYILLCLFSSHSLHLKSFCFC